MSSADMHISAPRQAIVNESDRRAYAKFCRNVLAGLRGCGSAEFNERSLPDMRVLERAIV